MSRRQALLLGLIGVGITGLICGGILWKHMASSDRSEAVAQETYPEAETDAVTGEPDTEEEPENQGSEAEAEWEMESAEAEDASETEIAAPTVTADSLVIRRDPELYTYEDLEADTRSLAALYPEFFRWDSLGTTADGRQLLHFVIGDPGAEQKLFVNGGIHAREYITSQLVMKQTEAFLQHLYAGDSYGGQSYEEILRGKAIHVVAMVNPDGIAISQSGLEGIRTESVRDQVFHIAELDGSAVTGEYLRRWKANGNGVDLNRNFDALWDQYAGAGHPSSDHYKGSVPGSETEAAALIGLTEKEQFDRTISYHTQGQVIYWYFAQEGTLYQDTKRLADRISSLTGYPLDADYEHLDPAGYKDWAIQKKGIPSLTIEVGSVTSPVPSEQFASIWGQNMFVWEETLLEMSGK